MGESHLPRPACKEILRKRAVPIYLGQVHGRCEPIRCSINISLLNECVCETPLTFIEIRVPNLLSDVTQGCNSRGETLRCMHPWPSRVEGGKKKSTWRLPCGYRILQATTTGSPKCFSFNSYWTCLNWVSSYLGHFCFLQDQSKIKNAT